MSRDTHGHPWIISNFGSLQRKTGRKGKRREGMEEKTKYKVGGRCIVLKDGKPKKVMAIGKYHNGIRLPEGQIFVRHVKGN